MNKAWRSKKVDGRIVYNPAYFCWRNMIQRCRNPHNRVYSYYGGRGIRVCERWQNYDNFYADMGDMPPGYTLDRVDPDGHYEPDNCRWVTRTVNQRNQRRSKYITWQGERRHFIEWAELLGLNPETLRGRVYRKGWPLERAMTEGVNRG